MSKTNIVFYSGGLGSYECARRVIQADSPENTQLLFTDTLTEDEDLYRFITESASHLGAELIWLKEGRDVWEVFNDVRYMGNTRIDPCSQLLKRNVAKRWITARYTPKTASLFMGIDWSEVNRMDSIATRWEGWDVSAPLCDPPLITKSEIMEGLRAVGIEPPRLYGMGFQHNNCGGFCVKAGKAHFKRLWDAMPERYLYHEEQQEALFLKIGKSHGFLRHGEGGKVYYLSLREYRVNHLEKGVEIDPFDIGGCACFSA
jgi:hypothetical protein